MVIFKSKQKKLEGDFNLKLCGERLYPTESAIKYLGVKIDMNLTWQNHVNDLSIKLNRANVLISKIRKYISPKMLRSIYFASNIINFQPKNSHTNHLFKQNFILKFQDKIHLENILFVSKSLNNLSPSIFNTWFSFSLDQHNYETSSSTQGNLMKLFYKTGKYGKYSITVSAVELWSKIQK